MIEELDFDYKVFTNREDDKALVVRFYMEALRNEEKSIAEGRPIYDDTEFVEIRVRGDRNNIVQRPARVDDQRRWPDAYKQFKTGEEGPLSGTPLKEWPSMTKSMLEELKHMGFQTVEQLAGASDTVCSKFGGLQSFKQKAILYLDFAKGAQPLDKLQKQVETMANEREVDQRNMKEALDQIRLLTAQNEALSKKAK